MEILHLRVSRGWGRNWGQEHPKFSPLTAPSLNTEGRQVHSLRLHMADFTPQPTGLRQPICTVIADCGAATFLTGKSPQPPKCFKFASKTLPTLPTICRRDEGGLPAAMNLGVLCPPCAHPRATAHQNEWGSLGGSHPPWGQCPQRCNLAVTLSPRW